MRLRLARRCLVVLLAAVVLGAWASVAWAQSVPYVIRVEEDWELVVGDPDANTNAPQVSCVVAPVGNVDGHYATLSLNHQSLPDFVAGGIQLQVWSNETPVEWRKFPDDSLINTPSETIRWTQTMELAGGQLTFEVVSGTSTTWGVFGGQGYLKASVATTLENLNAYNPAVSVENSGVSFAANRVQSLVLRRVRLVMSNGEVLEDNTARTVGQ
jgi:hypothetical protein